MRFYTGCLSLLFCCFMSLVSYAAPFVTFNISAVVDVVDDPLNVLMGSIAVNDPLMGTLQYDLALPDSDSDPDFGSYVVDPPGNNFFNGVSGAAGSFETLFVFGGSVINNSSGSDTINLFAAGDATPSALANPLIDFVDLEIYLEDTDQTAIADDSLPSTLNLSDFETAEVIFSAESDTMSVFTVFATITGITKVIADFDEDNDADGDDLLKWQRDNLGSDALELWKNTYGESNPVLSTVSTVVPEPSTIWLAFGSLQIFGYVRRAR